MDIKDFLFRLNYRHFVRKCYRMDIRRYQDFSYNKTQVTESGLAAQLAIKTHVLEKGLCMDNMRLGFGKDNLTSLIKDCKRFMALFGDENPFLLRAVAVILEYRSVHDEKGYNLSASMLKSMDELISKFPETLPSNQIQMLPEDYFSKVEEAFPSFSWSRHSLRHFGTAHVSEENIRKAVDLAQNAPSACNRQASRVYLISDKNLISKVLKLQGGNRGFGDQTDKLLILTVDLSSYTGAYSRNLGFMDSGIYAMNLLYALHYHKIGACPVNWCDSPSDDRKLRETVRIPDKETVTLMILCGSIPEEKFKIAASARLDGNLALTKLEP